MDRKINFFSKYKMQGTRAAVLAQLALQLTRVAQQILIAKVILSALGVGVFTQWTLLHSILAFIGMLDFGVQGLATTQLIKLGAKSEWSNFNINLGRYISYYIILFLIVITIILFCTFFNLSTVFFQSFGVSVDNGQYSAAWLGIAYLVGMPSTMFGAVYAAHGYSSLGILRVAFLVILQTLVVVFVSFFGGGLVLMCIGYALCAVIVLTLMCHDITKRFPFVVLSIVWLDFIQIKEIIKSGFPYFINPFVVMLLQSLPLLVMAKFGIASEFIGAFVLCRIIIGLMRQAAAQVCAASAADAGRLYYIGGIQALMKYYVFGQLFINIIIGVLSGFVLIFGPSIIHLWSSGVVKLDILTLQMMTISVLISSSAYAVLSVSPIIGKSFYPLVNSIVQLSVLLIGMGLYLSGFMRGFVNSGNLLIIIFSMAEIISAAVVVLMFEDKVLQIGKRCGMLRFVFIGFFGMLLSYFSSGMFFRFFPADEFVGLISVIFSEMVFIACFFYIVYFFKSNVLCLIEKLWPKVDV